MTGVSLLVVMRFPTNREHTTVLVTKGAAGDLLVAERPRFRDRLAARWHPRRLDRALADGTPPEASPALALRARELTELSQRRSIAGALRRVLRESREGARTSYGRVVPDRARVAAAGDELSLLADALDGPGPVAAPGVAQAWILLTDGTGPLYNSRSRTSLCARAARAATELRAWPV